MSDMANPTVAAITARFGSRRRLLKYLLASASCASWSGCTSLPSKRAATSAAPAAPLVIRGKGYRLVQNWDFGVTITNLEELRDAFFTRYIYNDGKLDVLNREWQRYRDNDNHIFEDAALALVARAPSGLTRGKIESGMLRSKWSGQYGYFECRMKVPDGRGMWPAFWLNPEDKTWPPEIDVVEFVNNGRDTTRNSFHFIHSAAPEQRPIVITSLLDKDESYRPGFDYKDDFHTFAVDWTTDRVRHFVDDVLVTDRQFRWLHKDGTNGGPAHVLLNLAVGGKWPGPPVDENAFPGKLLVKYIRVWQR
jgi:beta-glucanase (GH16 family)